MNTRQNSRKKTTVEEGEYHSRRPSTRNTNVSKKKRRKKRKKTIFLFILLLLLLLIAVGVFTTLYFISKIQDIKNDPLQDIKINKMSDQNIDDYTNIILYGVDSRANELKKFTRSDSIILASIHNKTHEVTLTSIYRDTYVRIDEHGYSKVNHAYSYGGPELSVNTLNQNFDLNIQDFITVNFNVMANVIDALGGITLHIQKDELKWVNAYAHDVAKIDGKKFKKIPGTGKRKLNGVQAVGYCRVRYTAGGDFTRAQRQRRVMKAIFRKAQKSSPFKLYRAMNEILPQIYTSLSTKEILNLAKWLPFYKIKQSKGFPYSLDCHRASDGIYYDFPTTLSSNVTKMHKKLFGTKQYTPSDTVKEIEAGMGATE